MQTYALISQKGGAGKSTLARQLSVIVGEDEPVILIDRDPQQTTTKWWNRRQESGAAPDKPDLLELSGMTLTVAAAALRSKPGALFIDTRPAVGEPEAEAARVADLVIVPVRPSPDDLEAVGDTLKILRRLEKRAVLVVNAAKNEVRAINARAALSRYPVPVCPTHLSDRTVFLDASLEGRGVGEMKGSGAREALDELRRVWNWIKEVRDEQQH